MKRLEQLPEITNRALGGLNATEGMKYRILQEASQGKRSTSRRSAWVPALCASLALVMVLGVSVPLLSHQSGNDVLIHTMSAGDGDVLANENRLTSLNTGSVNVGSQSTIPGFRSLWAPSNGGSFPLIGVNGRYYRMMTSPSSVSSNLLGSCLGEVQEFTTEPALAGSSSIMSNKVGSGTPVYEIRGMGNTLVAAEVGGKYQLFQRVSFNSNALRGNESLKDTLEIAGHITMMELSGIGVVSDRSTCEKLFATLCSQADYASSSSISSQQSLLIELDNGLTVQLMVKNDKLGACGVWSCPEFFEQFAAAVQ